MKTRTVDDFSEPQSWLPVASGNAQLKIASEEGETGRALRLDFDFKGGGGFVVARKEFSLGLPEAYTFSFKVRGESPKNKLEFKLADPTGKNVWRWQQDEFDFHREARSLNLRSSQIEFAWGPAGGGTLRKLGSVEFVISAGPGGRGTVWLEDFRFENRTSRKAPLVTASSSAKGSAPKSVLQRDARSSWRGVPSDKHPLLEFDFHQPREYGGLVIDWEPRPTTRAFTVQASDDRKKWRTIHRTRRTQGRRSFIYLPNGESRFLRLAFTGAAGIRHLEVKPFDFSRSLIEFFHSVAECSPRGKFPRYLSREQSYWTCSGVLNGFTCALINEEGMVEPDKGSFSLEPFLYADGRLITWADVKSSVHLEPGGLAIPSAVWEAKALTLQTTAFATGHEKDAVQFVRYRVTNNSKRALRLKLFVAIRPFQVSPPWQSWQKIGGISEIKQITWRDGIAWVNRTKPIVPLSKPAAFGAAAFEQGVISDFLAEGILPPEKDVHDDFGFASAAMRFDLAIPPSTSREVYVAAPFGITTAHKRLRKLAKADGAVLFDEAVNKMRTRVGEVSFRMPSGVAREAALTFHTAAGQILINRDGPALQPGPRRYTRSWIRDGAIMGAALLRIGDFEALPNFIRWYAPFQRKDGFVPCCVDRNGPDWLVEHDSHGQLIYGVMESYRFTGDRTFLQDMWPHAHKAATHIEELCASRLTPEYDIVEKRPCRGLLPESASHEGYLAHPVHSYWDDFWALRGLKDSVTMASLLGYSQDARHFTEVATKLQESLRTSIRTVIADKKLNYVPGSVEWADFDPTATSNAVTLLQGMADLPARELSAMFDTFVHDFRRKHRGEMPWTNYTAYEIRIIGALVHLGKRAEALELLEFFLKDRRPRNWNQWPEISWKNPRSPGHLGDVPHTWIASEYMLVFSSLFAYEREADDALIVGAGLDGKWLRAKGGVSVKCLPTWHGNLDLALHQDPTGVLHVTINGKLRQPNGGFVVRPPGEKPIHSFTVNGRSHTPSASAPQEAVIHEFPAEAAISFVKTPPVP